jgi:hypothetical protein
MSIIGNRRSIAHPDWLKTAMKDFESTQRNYARGVYPSSIEFFMLTTPIHRLLRCCFRNHWAMLWWLFVKALQSERERIGGILWRFWHYRILMESEDAALNEMLSQNCPKCGNRCTFSTPDGPRSGDEELKCDGCGAISDFEERFAVAEDDEDD